MRSQSHKKLIVSIIIALVVGAGLFLVLIGPGKKGISNDLDAIARAEKEFNNIAGDNGKEKIAAEDLFGNRATVVEGKMRELITNLSFTIPDTYNVVANSKTSISFPIDRSKVVGDIRERFPTFPFDALMGLDQIPSSDPVILQDFYTRLAICTRILEVLGEAGVDNVLKFEHKGEDTVKNEGLLCSIKKRKVAVSFEGRINTIIDALKALATPGRFLRIEEISMHASRSGYSIGCDLVLSAMTLNVEDIEQPIVPQPTPTPGLTPTPSQQPSDTTLPTPANTPVAPPTQTPNTPTPTPTQLKPSAII
jgi:hypothetical protein